MHLVGLRPGTWYWVVPAPDTAAAHMRNDLWLEVDGRVQWFGRSARLEFKEDRDEDQDSALAKSRRREQKGPARAGLSASN